MTNLLERGNLLESQEQKGHLLEREGRDGLLEREIEAELFALVRGIVIRTNRFS